MKTLGRIRDLDVVRKSRLKKATLFEMDPTPEVLAVQQEYLRIAENLCGAGMRLPSRR